MPAFHDFEDLLIHELQDLYDVENQILKALPKMEKEAYTPQLKQAFRAHFQETKKQVIRLERALNILDADYEGDESKAMTGLIAEGGKVLRIPRKSVLKDAAIIGAAQKIEHYEIAAYGTAKAHAELLDLDEIVDLLQDSLDEEEEADRKLTKIAEGTFFSSGVNRRALKV